VCELDTVSKNDRSRIMACVKSSGNKSTEQKFVSILKNARITGWRRKYTAYGNPDFVFPSKQVAVFVDGCFWHYCPKHCRIPSTNVEYWVKKISQNAKRDLQVTIGLKKRGWIVIRFWEHELKGGKDFIQKIGRLKRIVNKTNVVSRGFRQD